MPRAAACARLVLAVLVVACSDGTRSPTAAPLAPTGPRTTTAPGTLDQQVTTLVGALFPTGLETAAGTRWESLKDKYAAGLTDPSQMSVARKMLVDLSSWVQQKTPQMDTPPAGMTRQAAAAQLVLYMADYVYFGPNYTPQSFPPGTDAAVAVVTPSASAVVVTPSQHAGVAIDAGSVTDNTIVVVRQNPAYYPANCSGPLTTRYCQYPQFYQFDEFPHVPLKTPAHFSVCHVNSGPNREPLADHDRFRLAHTLPASPADYTPGAAQVDGIEILPLIHQSFTNCPNGVDYVPPPSTNRIGMLMYRGHQLLRGLARLAVTVIAPAPAAAIDQGGGGDALSFSDFNDVDSLSRPDNAVQNLGVPSNGFAGDPVTVSFDVADVGTASSDPTTASIHLVPASGPVVDLASVAVGALVPQVHQSFSQSVTIPETAAPGSYSISVTIAPNSGLPELALANDTAHAPITIATHPLVVSPAAPSMVPGATQGFTVVSGGAGPYTWSVNGDVGGSVVNGLVSAGGSYAAPWAVAQTRTVSVCAARQVNPAWSGCAIATVTAPGDVVVFNDINIFDEPNGGQIAGNVQLWKNLVNQFAGAGPRAAGNVVWIHRGHAMQCDLCLDQYGQWYLFESTLAAQGYTVTDVNDVSGDLTAIPAGVKLVVLVMPQTNYSVNELNGLKSFVNGGGRLMFVGEWDGYYNSFGGGIAVENAFLAAMGAAAVNIGGNADCLSATLSGSQIHANPITANVTQLGVFCTSVLSLSANDALLFSDAGNRSLAAVVAVDLRPTVPVIASRVPSLGRSPVGHPDLAPGTMLTSTGVVSTTTPTATRASRRP